MQKKIYTTLSIFLFCLYIFIAFFVRTIIEIGLGFAPFFLVMVSIIMTLWGAVLVHRSRQHAEKIGTLVVGMLFSVSWLIMFLFIFFI